MSVLWFVLLIAGALAVLVAVLMVTVVLRHEGPYLKENIAHGQYVYKRTQIRYARFEGLHVDSYKLNRDDDVRPRWDYDGRYTPYEEVPCTHLAATDEPCLPWSNVYYWLTDWHADGECEQHRPRTESQQR